MSISLIYLAVATNFEMPVTNLNYNSVRITFLRQSNG